MPGNERFTEVSKKNYFDQVRVALAGLRAGCANAH